MIHRRVRHLLLPILLGLAVPAPAQENEGFEATLEAATSYEDVIALATTPEEVAAVIAEFPEEATAILRAAGNLGIPPAEVVAVVVTPATPDADVAGIVEAAVAADPDNADNIAASAFSSAGGGDRNEADRTALAEVITSAAVRSVEANVPDPETSEARVTEVVAALQDAAPGSRDAIAQSAADATTDPTDTGETVSQAVAENLGQEDPQEQADAGDETGDDDPLGAGDDFGGDDDTVDGAEAPSESQDTGSPN